MAINRAEQTQANGLRTSATGEGLSVAGDVFGANRLGRLQQLYSAVGATGADDPNLPALLKTPVGRAASYANRIGNAVDDIGEQRRQFGVADTTARINQQTTVAGYRYNRLDRTADVVANTQSGIDQTLEARADVTLRPQELQARLAAIRASTLAQNRNLTEMPGGGIAAQAIGSYVYHPGLQNTQASRDLVSAQQLAGRAAGALGNAATGKGPSTPSTAKLEALVQGLGKQLADLSAALKKMK